MKWRLFRFHFNHLSSLLRGRGGLQAGMYRNFPGRLDSEPDAISPDFQNSDFNVVGQNDLFILLAANDQHASLSPVDSAYTALEKSGDRKNTDIFGFLLFNFVCFSGTLTTLFT
jgi:hypothetical protein